MGRCRDVLSSPAGNSARGPRGAATIGGDMTEQNTQSGEPRFYESAPTLAEYIQLCCERFAEQTFLAELGGRSLSYGEAAQQATALAQTLKRAGVRPGDRVALLGPNSIHWGIAYLAVLTSGAVAVPILNEFHPTAIHNIVNMSGSKVIFVAAALVEKLAGGTFPDLERALLLEDFQELDLRRLPELVKHLRKQVEQWRERAGQFLTEHNLPFAPSEHVPQPGDLAAIVYTSGTTGYSKGVMLTQENLVSDVKAAVRYVDLGPSDRFLSLLPLAHTYECTCCFLAAMHAGSSVTFLHQKPSPKVLQEAFAAVRPTIVFAVPLIIEKIYRKKVLPRIQGHLLLRTMTRVPLLRRVVLRKAVAGLLQAFGGQIKFMGFGGAALPADVERFLRIGGFPYAVGYGMTECSPLISGSRVRDTRLGSCGTPVAGIELRIADPDPVTGIGEVQVRGPMVAQGYYRNPEATEALFTADGFLHTGDLGVQDGDGFVYLKGRSKNLILGPSGENIYPEEIEGILGRYPSVLECVVVKRGERLEALIYPDYDLLRRELSLRGCSDPEITAAIGDHFKAIVAEVNTQLAAYSRLSGFRLVEQEFDKTPTEKIKRHLYE